MTTRRQTGLGDDDTTQPLPQRDRILNMLQVAGDNGVCGHVFLRMFIARYAARIHELRGLGYLIDTAPCERHGDGRQVANYTLGYPTWGRTYEC